MDLSDRSQADEQDIATSGGETVLVLITTATRDEADRIARGLVEQRLAACVTIAKWLCAVSKVGSLKSHTSAARNRNSEL